MILCSGIALFSDVSYSVDALFSVASGGITCVANCLAVSARASVDIAFVLFALTCRTWT